MHNHHSELTDLASQLQGIFGLKNWDVLWQTFTLTRNWEEVAGKQIADRTEPAYIQNHILWVQVRNSVWMQHMQSLKPQLLERVREFLPQLRINDIRWMIQPAGQPARDNQAGVIRKHPPDPEQQKAFEQIATVIENRECREALCRLWRNFHKY